MRGKSTYKKHILKPDYRYNSVLLSKFINYLMADGKKEIATNIVYTAFDIIKKKINKEPLQIFDQAVENASPILEVKPRRIGGATYLVPIEVRPERRVTLALRAIVDATTKKQGKPAYEFLADEIMAAFNNEGSAIAKKDELHKMAEANKAFAHYAKF